MKYVINSRIAWAIRSEMGQLLNPACDFENPRLKEIAIEMEDLKNRWNKLDEEILAIRIAEFGPIEENED